MAGTTVIIDVEINEADTLAKLNNLVKVIKENKDETLELTKANKTLGENYKDNADEIAQNTAKIQANKTELKMLEAEQKSAVGVLNTLKKDTVLYGDSLNEQRAALGNLKQQYAALSAAQRESTGGKEMLKTMSDLNSQILETEKSFGVYSRQVGNYEIANKGLKQELRELLKDMDGLVAAGGRQSVEYQELAERASAVKKEMNSMRMELDAVGKSGTNIQALGGAFQGVAMSFDLYSRALEQVNIDNANAEVLMKKMQVVMTALLALEQLRNMTTQKSIVFQASKNLLDKVGITQTTASAKAEAAKAVVMGTGSIATKAAAAAQWLLNAAMSANPAILILTAVLALITGIALLTKSTKEAESAQASYNYQIQEHIRILERQKEVQDEYFDTLQRQIDRMKAQGQAVDEIKKKEKELAEARFAAANARADQFQDEINNLEKNKQSLIDLQNKERALERERENASKKRKKKIEKELKDIKEMIEGFEGNIQIGVEISTEVKKAKETLEDIADATVKTQKDAAKKAKEEREKQMKATLDAARVLEDEILKARKKGAELDIEQEKVSTRRRIEELQKRLDTEKNLSKKAREDIAATIEQIQKNSNARIVEINKKYSEDELNKQVSAEQKRIQLLLEVATKGSEAERVLRMQMIDLLRNEEIREYQKTLDLRLQAVKSGSDEELQIWTQSIEELNAITLKYELQRTEVVKAETRKREAEITQAIKNDYQERLLLAYDNEIETTQIELEAAQQRAEYLKNLDAETKAALFETEAQYKATVLQNRQEIIDAEKRMMQAQVQFKNQQLQNVNAVAQGIGNVVASIAKDNEQYADFAKALALFEIGINTAVAISGAISAATPGDPYSVAARIAAAVLAAVAGMAAALGAANSASPPKFAGGGIVGGSSFTGDNVPIRVNSGEIVMNPRQQRELWNSINSGTFGSGFDYGAMAEAFRGAVEDLPPSNLIYSEFDQFTKDRITYEEARTI